MHKKMVSLVLLVICGLLIFTACAPAAEAPASEAPEAEAPAPAAEEPAPAAEEPAPAAEEPAPAAEEPAAEEPAADGASYRVLYSTQDASNPSMAFLIKMFEKHAPTYNIEITCVDGKSDAATQAQQITDAVTQAYDLIIVSPNDPNGIVPSIMAAGEANIPVALICSDLNEENHQYRAYYVGADDYQGGVAAGKAFADQFPDGAQVVEIGGQSGNVITNNRHDGFIEGAQGSGVELLDSQDVIQWDANECLDIMANFIVEHGGDAFQGVYCHWDGGLTACVQAMRDAGLDPASYFSVAIDGNKDGFNNINEGVQNVSIMQNFDNMADLCLQLGKTILDGGTIETDVNMPPWGIVTPETIDTFTVPEW